MKSYILVSYFEMCFWNIVATIWRICIAWFIAQLSWNGLMHWLTSHGVWLPFLPSNVSNINLYLFQSSICIVKQILPTMISFISKGCNLLFCYFHCFILLPSLPVLISSWRIFVSFQGIQLSSWCSSKSSCQSNGWGSFWALPFSSFSFFLASLRFFLSK